MGIAPVGRWAVASRPAMAVSLLSTPLRLGAAIAAAILVLFAAVELLAPGAAADLESRLRAGGAIAAALGVGALVVDPVAPVPSSVVMAALGVAFGGGGGFVLALAGTTGGALVGVWLGRAAGARLLPRRERAERALSRWGLLAVAATRPVPVMAETVLITAAAAGRRPGPLVAAAIAGNVPYALAMATLGGSL